MTKDESNIIKGVAVILMLMHHLWAFPERIVGGGLSYAFSIFEQPLITYIGNFGKICVYIFFFVGGYGIYISSSKKGFHIIGSIKKLFISYWKVFFIFIPIAFLLFRNQPDYCANASICGRYSTFIWSEFIENLLGISCTYNSEWWFLREYLIALAMFPALKYYVDSHSNVMNIITVLVCTVLVSTIFPMLASIDLLGELNNDFIFTNFLCKNPPYISCFWAGCVFAKDNFFEKLREEMREYHLTGVFKDIVIILTIIYLKNTGYRDQLCIIYVPFLIACVLDIIEKSNIINQVFLKLGNHSTNIWLIHSFFCYYFYPINKIVTCTRYAVPSLIVLLVLSYLSSIAINTIWKFLSKFYFNLYGKLLNSNC